MSGKPVDPRLAELAIAAHAPAPNLPQIDPADGQRLREALHRTGLGMNELARLWKVDPRRLRSWLEGRAPIPGMAWRLAELEAMVRGR